MDKLTQLTLTPRLKAKRMGSFRSYVGLDEYEVETIKPVYHRSLEPRLLPGEIVIAEATEVNLFTTLSRNSGIPGALYVTNARIIFTSLVQGWEQYSVPLLSIHTLCYYEEDKRKGRHRIKMHSLSVSKSQPLSARGNNRVFEMLLTCSNFRTLNVSFKSSKIDQGVNVFNMILKFAIPECLEKLFYFDYKKAVRSDSEATNGANSHSSCNRIVPFMDAEIDWYHELKKTRGKISRFKVSDINRNFQMCNSLPEWVVIPEDIPESKIRLLAEKLIGCRPPFWVWGNDKDSAIIRMGKLHQEADLDAENSFFEKLRKSNCDMREARIEDIESLLPPKEIKVSFNRLVDLCCPESIVHYEDNDLRFLSLLENTKWLQWICRTLDKATELAEYLHRRSEILVLRESDSRDVTCLMSSLVQVILDPRFRTAAGLLSLVQKEWIATGHPFHELYLHSSSTFLLFLDCVYQLLEQNPFEFEFNDNFLTELWDANFDCTTGTFLFDTPKQRSNQDIRKDLYFWPRLFEKVPAYVPKETDSFKEKRKAVASMQFLFPGQHGSIVKFPVTFSQPSEVRLLKHYQNPMYKLRSLLNTPPLMNVTALDQNVLICSSCICDVALWKNLYLRRTLYTNPLVTSRNHRDSLSSQLESTPSTPESPKQTLPSHTDAPATELLPVQHRMTGRNPALELQLVENMLNTLSISNRYSKNFRSMSSQQNIPPVPPPKPRPAERRNPFLTRL